MVTPPDDEAIAALIDGTLQEPERSRVLALIASSPSAYEVFRDASDLAAAVADDEQAAAPSAARPIKVGSRRRLLWYVAPLAVAASLLIALIVPKVNPHDALISTLTSSATAGNGATGRLFGANWNVPPWSVARSAEPNLSREGLAFRMGARLLQVETAAALSDTTALGVAVSEVADLARSIPGATALATGLLREWNEGSLWTASTRTNRRALFENASGMEPYLELGRAAEAARHASSRGDAEYFAERSPARRHMRSVVEGMERATPTPQWQVLVSELSGLFVPNTPGANVPSLTSRKSTEEAFTRVPW